MEIMEHYLYTKEHEWINVDANVGTVGITEYAQSSLGDITFIELPEENDEVEQFEQFASVESVKAASDIYSPMSGKVIEVNSDLVDTPEVINKDCYGKGWFIKIELSDAEEGTGLMTADEYRKYVDSIG